MNDEIILLQVITKYDFEDLRTLKGRIIKEVRAWCLPGGHAKRNLIFVVVTNEGIEAFAARLRPLLLELMESGGVERFFFTPAPEVIISDYGHMDPLVQWVRKARVEISERSKSKRLRNLERRRYSGRV